MVKNTKELFFNLEKNKYFKIVFFFIGAQIIFFALGEMYNHINKTDYEVYEYFFKWDARWYEIICSHKGYETLKDIADVGGGQHSWAFFPLYPMFVSCFSKIFSFVPLRLCGIIVSNICTFITAYYIIKYVKLKNVKPTLDINIFFFILYLGPFSFYFNLMYTEAMFAMFLLMFFYYCKTKRYLLAGICSAFASATRLIGVLLVFVLVYNMVCEAPGTYGSIKLKYFIKNIFREPVKLFSILCCPLGAFCFMLYLYFTVGDVWAFRHVQIGWGRKNKAAITNLYYALSGKEGGGYIFLGICVILIIVLLLYLYKIGYRDECIYSLVTLYIPLRSSVGCFPRYAVGVFFPILSLAYIVSNCKLKKCLLLLLALIEVFLVCSWYKGEWFLA